MIKAGIIGGAGYTAGELIRLLLNHPEVSLDFIYSTSNAGNELQEVHRDLLGETDLKFDHKIYRIMVFLVLAVFISVIVLTFFDYLYR